MPTYRAFFSFLLGSVCVVGLARPAAAQTSFVMLGSTFPTGVQRGKTTEVTVRAGGNGGANLYGAYKALFEGEGVQAEIVPPEKGWPAKDPKKPWDLPGVGEVKMKVTVAADAPLGVREFRVATARMGISSVGQLVIGDEPEVVSPDTNRDIEHALPVTLPCVANGRLKNGEQVDNYRLKVEAGQEVVFAVLCARLQDKVHDLQEHADPLLILRDLSGSELARNDDYYRADPMLHYKFDKAGEYVIQIRDVNYHGNEHWVYRLTMTSRPYVVAVVPCAVRPGQSYELHVTGFNLGGAQTVHLDVPPTAPPGEWQTSLKFPNGTSNLVSLLVSEAPQAAIEGQPNARAGSQAVTAALPNAQRPTPDAHRLSLPGGVNSWLSAEGQRDRYAFHAKKDEAWAFEVMSRRLDSEMDSELTLRNAKGDVLASNDDALGKDSRLEWKAPEDGDYTLEVRDVAGRFGPTYFYNLTATRLLPDFRLKCDPDRALIAPGNRTSWYVQVERRNGFAGPVAVEVKGLPAGVSVTPLTIPPELSTGTLILSAAPDAKIDAASVQVVGKAELPGADGKPVTVSRVARPLTEIYIPGGGRGLLEVDTQGVAVTETNDLEVSTNTQTVTLAPGGTVK
ncbi:MAG TPA: hypothetical protein VFB21_11950, partial [Chthonomonadaceae bacterium]|nr:hypothetical protein [Chthonomonadaceae bacterium]